MQRYRWDRIDEELVADPNGECVPADVAQALYDALEDIMNCGAFIPGFVASDAAQDKARAALAAADEEGEG